MSKKLSGLSFILIGFLFLFGSMGMMYLLMQAGWFLGTMRAHRIEVPAFTTYVTVGWAFAVLQLITGFVALAAGIAFLVKKPSPQIVAT